MEYGRAGFYTYDLVDNGGYPSADEVLEQYQNLAVGDWAFNMNSLFGKELPLDESNAFRVSGFEINEWLLWEKPDSVWSWLLKPMPGGKTRLILRIRAHPGNLFWMLFMEFGDPPMVRRMLKGIKFRAENPNSPRPPCATISRAPGGPIRRFAASARSRRRRHGSAGSAFLTGGLHRLSRCAPWGTQGADPRPYPLRKNRATLSVGVRSGSAGRPSLPGSRLR